MKEVKFGAYDKKLRWDGRSDVAIIDWDSKCVLTREIWNEDKETGEADCQAFFDEIDIVQYTGLKDKNGKEIYEGDILKNTYPAGYSTYEVQIGIFDNHEGYEDNERGCGVYLKQIFEHYYVEKWKEQAYDKWYGDGEEKISNIFGYPNINELEVIGNIYENPELLRKVRGR